MENHPAPNFNSAQVYNVPTWSRVTMEKCQVAKNSVQGTAHREHGIAHPSCLRLDHPHSWVEGHRLGPQRGQIRVQTLGSKPGDFEPVP